MLQDTVWSISVALIAGMAAVFLWVAAGAGRRADGGRCSGVPIGCAPAGSGCSLL